MKGYPKTIATSHDLVVALSTEPNLAKQYIRTLIAERMVWAPVEMQDLEDDTHKIVINKDTDDNETRQQYELVEDQNCKLFRLGLTVADAEERLKGF